MFVLSISYNSPFAALLVKLPIHYYEALKPFCLFLDIDGWHLFVILASYWINDTSQKRNKVGVFIFTSVISSAEIVNIFIHQRFWRTRFSIRRLIIREFYKCKEILHKKLEKLRIFYTKCWEIWEILGNFWNYFFQWFEF